MVETHLKKNYIDWLPFKEGKNMLVLSESMDNLDGMWDCIVVGDAFAKVPEKYTGKDVYTKFFDQIKEHLNNKGHVILAVDNRYGLQFFAGCKERLTGKYFEGVEGYPESSGVCTFSKETMLEMAKTAGFASAKTYYPYPNYRYMTALYTDWHLPAPGELKTDLCNFEEERAVLFRESKVFDGLIKEGRFQEFSNSYLFELTLEEQNPEEEILFVKYSVERDERFRIRTEIVKKADGTKVVRKVPYGESAKAHVEKIKHWEEILKEQYNQLGISVNNCNLTNKGAEFEFLKGRTFEDVLDDYLEKEDFAGLFGEIRTYIETLEKLSEFPVNNLDLIFSNIILIDGRWHVIDYEWTFEVKVPWKFILHRSLTLYCQSPKRKVLESMGIYQIFGISKEEEEKFLEMEHQLQLHLLGNTKTMAALQHEYSGKIIDLKELLKRSHQPEMKIYLDYGQGFSEKHAYVTEVEEDFFGRRRCEIPLPSGVVAVRIDPCEESCQVQINRMLGECAGTYELNIGHNGKAYEKSILYTTKDPQILIGGIVPGSSQIHVDITVEYLKEETSYVWMELLAKAEKCDRIEASKPYRLMKKIKKLLKKG